jgi:hypothetical protein
MAHEGHVASARQRSFACGHRIVLASHVSSILQTNALSITALAWIPTDPLPFLLPLLAVIALEKSAERKVFVELGPVKSKRRQLNVIKLAGCACREPGIVRNRESDFGPALHRDNNMAVAENSGAGDISYGVHASAL